VDPDGVALLAPWPINWRIDANVIVGGVLASRTVEEPRGAWPRPALAVLAGDYRGRS